MIYTVCLGPVDWLFKGKSMNKGSELGDAIQASFVETQFSQVPVFFFWLVVIFGSSFGRWKSGAGALAGTFLGHFQL